jgi:hypothetical protein
MTKEIIKEIAEKYVNNDLDLYESLINGYISYDISMDLLHKLFIAGAQWQAERMYSEEDLREAYKHGRIWDMTSFEEWFEQFKNK